MKITRTLMVAVAAGMLCGSLALTGCQSEIMSRTDAEEQIDQQLVEQVKLEFGNSPSFKFPDVQVVSYKGNIQLSGFVRSDEQKEAAGNIAEGIPGVISVENGIALKQ